MNKKNINKIISWVLLLAAGCWLPVSGQQVKQGPPVPENYCITNLERKLHSMINEYRRRYDLPPVPLSKSLSYVASAHAKDLYFNHPDAEPCNFHSWSDQGTWSPFCYPRDESKTRSVWDKPREMTTYKGKGYEIVYWENLPVTIDSIIPFWKSIGYFNSFLMNTGKWQGKRWAAIGIGIYENYACAWFGEAADPEGEPWICGNPPRKTVVKESPVAVKDTSVKEKQQPVKKTPESPPAKPQVKKEQAQPVQKASIVTTAVAGNYYIIVSSMQPREKSKAFATELARRGYPDAKVLLNGNKVRVSLMEFKEKSQADSALQAAKTTFKDAWILKP